MSKNRTKLVDKSEKSLADKLGQIPVRDAVNSKSELLMTEGLGNNQSSNANLTADNNEQFIGAEEVYSKKISQAHSVLFDSLDVKEFIPADYEVEVSVDSLESSVGYSSLIRQMHEAFFERVAFLRSKAGGCLSADEARKRAFHACQNEEEAKMLFERLMSSPLHTLDFNSLGELYAATPRVAENLWEQIKEEARAEFESGHLAANKMFPVPHMKQAWNIARYLGIRESFIADWQPQGGIEVALIDMLAQSFFFWQYWLEQVVLRSETKPREEHPEYIKWKQWSEETKNARSWEEGYWYPQYVTEQAAIEHAVQMADRFNRIFMRTLRQLRDLRRYSPVTINNAQQVNFAAEGGQQINVANNENE